MSRYFVANPATGASNELDFPALVSLLKGTTIISLADSDRFIEFGLSESLMVRIEAAKGSTLGATVVSTLNADEAASVRLQLISHDEEPHAALIEQRLHSIRQVYAIVLMLQSGRHEQLAAVLLKDPHVDVEQSLLADDERLYLEAAGQGTFWAALGSIAKKIGSAPQFALNTLSLVYGEGRSMLLARVRANTAQAQADAVLAFERAGRERDQRVMDLAKALDRTVDPQGKAAIQRRLDFEMNNANPQLTGPNIAGLLSPPEGAPA